MGKHYKKFNNISILNILYKTSFFLPFEMLTKKYSVWVHIIDRNRREVDSIDNVNKEEEEIKIDIQAI